MTEKKFVDPKGEVIRFIPADEAKQTYYKTKKKGRGSKGSYREKRKANNRQ